MDYKYNELQYAETIYKNGFQSQQHMPTELRLVAIYMRRILDYKPKILKEKFYEWCENNIPNYNKVIYYKIINGAINKAAKRGSCLVTTGNVNVYKQEIDYILKSIIIDANGFEYNYSYDCKKLMFTFLVRSKVNRQLFEQRNIDENKEYKGVSFSGGQKKYTELKKIAKLPQKLRINEDVIHYLYISKIVNPLNSGILRLDFLDDIYNNIDISNKEPVIIIKDFDMIGWYFDYYNRANKISRCEDCGKLFKDNTKNSNQKYCPECLSKNPYYSPIETKIIKCKDCGKDVEVDGIVKNVKRCTKCQEEYNSERNKIRVAKFRSKSM